MIVEGRAAVASTGIGWTATTERGPPDDFAGTWPLCVFSIAIGNCSNLMEGRAAVASDITGYSDTATTERGPPDDFAGTWPLCVFSIAIGNCSNLMEGRAAVASAGIGWTATTERGPPAHLTERGPPDDFAGTWPSRLPYNARTC